MQYTNSISQKLIEGNLQFIYIVFFNPKFAVSCNSVESKILFTTIGTRGNPRIREI